MDEWQTVRAALDADGIAGAEDFGRFVSNVEHFPPSTLDEYGAMPTLLRCLPLLNDPSVVTAVAGHLRRPWARPDAFDVLLAAFRRWAAVDASASWALGDALWTAADTQDLPELLIVAADHRNGTARQMVVHALWRFRKDARVEVALLRLIDDPEVSLASMPIRC